MEISLNNLHILIEQDQESRVNSCQFWSCARLSSQFIQNQRQLQSLQFYKQNAMPSVGSYALLIRKAKQIKEKAQEAPKEKEEVKQVKEEKKEPLTVKVMIELIEIDKVLAKIPIVVDLQKKYNTSRLVVGAAFASTFLYCLLVVLNIQGRLLSNVLAYYYPAYKSIKSIESKKEEKRWLAYW
jgi:predicted component of viral defense system (DUF524 family)